MATVADADEAGETQAAQAPGFGERGRMRRRARFLRKARELAYRDLGGLVFDLHRFGQRNDPLVLAKLATLRQIDTEVRELEAVLDDRRPVTVLREVGIAACPRCAAIHGSDDRFCPGCGLAFDAKADRPISTAPVSKQPQVSAPVAPTGTALATQPVQPSAPQPVQPSAPQPARPSTTQPAQPSAPQPAPPSAPQPTTQLAGPSAPQPSGPSATPPVGPSADSKATPVRAPETVEEEDEPTQIIRPTPTNK